MRLIYQTRQYTSDKFTWGWFGVCTKSLQFVRGSLLKDQILSKAIEAIGKLALETLLSGNVLLRKRDVVKEVGQDVFDYGLLDWSWRRWHVDTRWNCRYLRHVSSPQYSGVFRGFLFCVHARYGTRIGISTRQWSGEGHIHDKSLVP